MPVPLAIQGTFRPCHLLHYLPQIGLHRLAPRRLRHFYHLPAASGGDASLQQGPGGGAEPEQTGTNPSQQDGFWKRLKNTFLGDRKMDRLADCTNASVHSFVPVYKLMHVCVQFVCFCMRVCVRVCTCVVCVRACMCAYTCAFVCGCGCA